MQTLTQIGLRLHDGAPGTLAERASVAKAQGFTCCHLALSKTMGKQYMEASALTPGFARRVLNDLQGLDTAVLGCYLNLATPDMDEYRSAVAKYVAHLRFSRWMNAALVGTETGDPNKEYKYDPVLSHTEASLDLFIRRLAPVVEAAEKLGAIIAIEPVFRHIVCDGRRARQVLDAFKSPNLGIIFDPVNLLDACNLPDARRIIDEAIGLLQEDVLVVHMKDYVLKDDGGMKAVAAGTGLMDYSAVAEFVRAKKPSVQMTLENTTAENAEQAREFVRSLVEG